MPPIIDANICNGCGKCVQVCPCDVFYQEKKKETPIIKNPYECWHYAACVMECPVTGAIELRIPLSHMILYK
ncbi:ferredoxin family protein [Chloroflexota bacterium]